jgi:hypothetical protein
MLEVAETVFLASTSVCWFALMLINLIQIRNQSFITKQTLNHYLSRMNVVFAVGMFIERLAKFAESFFLVETFEALSTFRFIIRTLMAQLFLGISSFTTYQALLAAYSLEVVASDTATSTLRKRFIAINVISTVFSLVIVAMMHIINKQWLIGLSKIMWAVVLSVLEFYFWYYFLMLIRTARAMAEAVGIVRVQNSLRKPILATALTSVIILVLFGTAIAVDVQDMQAPREAMDKTEGNLMLLLACSSSTFIAWLPLEESVCSHLFQHHHQRHHRHHRQRKSAPPPPLRYAAQTRRCITNTRECQSKLQTHTHIFIHVHTCTRALITLLPHNLLCFFESSSIAGART